MVTRHLIIPQVVAVHGDLGTVPCLDVLYGQTAILLSLELIERANRVFSLSLKPGDAGEHCTIQGIDIASLHSGDSLMLGEVGLCIDKVGRLEAFHVVQNPALPPLLERHGVFTRVLIPGQICCGHLIIIS